MDEAAFLRVLAPYMRAFTERDADERMRLLALCMTESAQIYGPRVLFTGHVEIAGKMQRFQKNWPDGRLVMSSGLNIFHDAARFGCAIVDPDGNPRASGHAVVQLDPDGRIAKVFPYWEPLPPLPAGWPSDLASGGDSPALGSASTVSSASVSPEAVTQFLIDFERLAEQEDFSLIQDFIDEAACFRFNDGDFIGRDAIKAVFEKTWRGDPGVEKARFYLSDIVVLATDVGSAAATYTYNWEGSQAGRSFTVRGRGTRVLKFEAGRFRIVHEHLSRFPTLP